MYRRDAEFGKDSTKVELTSSFRLPAERKRNGEWRLSSCDPVYACMTSDFFIEEADGWRKEAWAFIRMRQDLGFCIVTKRIERFMVSIPDDWGDGYGNVTIISTCEDQKTADKRIPVMLELPIRHREIIHEPMLEAVDISCYLESGLIECVTCGGESGPEARLCDYAWILDTRRQCIEHGVPFHFKQTGAFFRKDGRIYNIPRYLQIPQARKAGIDYP